MWLSSLDSAIRRGGVKLKLDCVAEIELSMKIHAFTGLGKHCDQHTQ